MLGVLIPQPKGNLLNRGISAGQEETGGLHLMLDDIGVRGDAVGLLKCLDNVILGAIHQLRQLVDGIDAVGGIVDHAFDDGGIGGTFCRMPGVMQPNQDSVKQRGKQLLLPFRVDGVGVQLCRFVQLDEQFLRVAVVENVL